MRASLLWFALPVLAAALTGCATYPPGAERGPHGTMAYDVLIEASEPGARIEANGSNIGNTPVHLKIFGDPDGTFHDFGSFVYLIRAFPTSTNQFVHTQIFRTGRGFTPEDRIPERIYFDMNQQPPAEPPGGAPYGPPPGYPGYYGPPPYYYYGPGPYYYGPGVRIYFGGPRYRSWHR